MTVFLYSRLSSFPKLRDKKPALGFGWLGQVVVAGVRVVVISTTLTPISIIANISNDGVAERR